MAIYEYQCEKCGVFEVEQRISEPALTTCPHCSEKGANSSVQRIISASAFHLKGGGWYKSDYASSSSKSTTSSEASPSSSSSDSTSEKPAPLATTGCGTGCGCK